MRIRETSRGRRRRSAAPPGSAGNDSITSHTRMRKASIQPPRKPASRPERRRRSASTAAPTPAPTTSEMRAPYISADRMSRPWSSVPSRYLAAALGSQAGGRRASVSSSVRGRTGCAARPSRRTRAQKTQTSAIAAASDRHGRGAEAVADVAVEPAEQGLFHGGTQAPRPQPRRRRRLLLDRDPLEGHEVVGAAAPGRPSCSRPRPATAGAAAGGRCRPRGA